MHFARNWWRTERVGSEPPAFLGSEPPAASGSEPPAFLGSEPAAAARVTFTRALVKPQRLVAVSHHGQDLRGEKRKPFHTTLLEGQHQGQQPQWIAAPWAPTQGLCTADGVYLGPMQRKQRDIAGPIQILAFRTSLTQDKQTEIDGRMVRMDRLFRTSATDRQPIKRLTLVQTETDRQTNIRTD